ncbi:MAG: hypothetical protein ACOXZ4_02765 [Sphaerochaetaceae bacterium]
MKRRVGFVALILFATLIWADMPQRTEELLYSLASYDGKEYALTFAKEDAPAIYVNADADNFASVKKNFVYWWPLTETWILDDSVLDETLAGHLEIIDKKGTIRRLDSLDYTFFNVRGTYANNWQVKTGEEAHQEWDSYVQSYLDYQQAMTLYNRQVDAYKQQANALFYQILSLRDAGEDYEMLLQHLETLVPPQEPAVPTTYTVPPARVQKGFAINVPEGRYTIRFVTEEGLVEQNSEKQLIAIKPRRVNSIGYEVFSSDKWTMPTLSRTASSVLYVDGSSDLYVRPFFQHEYRDLDYQKLVNNQSSGNPSLYQWVSIQQVPNAAIKELSEGFERIVTEQPFMVEQSKTSTMGYSIVPYDPQGEHQGKTPSLVALHIPLKVQDKEYMIRLVDEPEAQVSSSFRRIRIIGGLKAEALIILLILIPLGVLGTVKVIRKKRLEDFH